MNISSIQKSQKAKGKKQANQFPTGKHRKASKPVSVVDGPSRQASVAAAYATGQRSKAPKITSSRDKVRIIHRELVGSITGSVAFAIAQTLALNPGLSSSFPWLATQAQSWERYRFNKLKFCYYTRTGSNVPGSVQMIPDYDSADAAPNSEVIASTYEDVEEDAPWKDIECILRPDALHALGPTKFIRTGALPANLDIKTYDAGNFFLATTDGTAVSWGKLWVEYDVELITPQMNPAGGGVISAQANSTLTPTTANLVGAAPLTSAGSAALVSILGEVLTFLNAGQFFVVYDVSGTTCTQTGVPVGAAGANIIASEASGSGTANMTQVVQLFVVVGSTLTFNNTLVAGTGANLLITQVPANLGPW